MGITRLEKRSYHKSSKITKEVLKETHFLKQLVSSSTHVVCEKKYMRAQGEGRWDVLLSALCKITLIQLRYKLLNSRNFLLQLQDWHRIN